MRVTFLGTGTAMPTDERGQTGILVAEDDRRLLIDCGSGVLHALQDVGPGYEAVDTVLLTHHHLDHVSDLMVLIKARWLAGEESLTIAGPAGTRELLDDLLAAHEYMQDRIDLTIREFDPGEAAAEDPDEPAALGDVDAVESFELAGFEIDARWTRHSLPCLAYRFDERFAFSGDSEAFDGLARFLDGTAVVAHDCSFPDEIDVSNHATPTPLGETLAAADVEIGRLYLTHLYPHTDGKHEEMLGALAEQYEVDARMAHDGLSVSIDGR